MKLTPTAIPGVVIVEPSVFTDDRGWFMESFNAARWRAALAELGVPAPRAFVQDNHSCSRRGVLRGLHFQRAPRAQGKLVRVVQGAAFDVAVDIRRDSPSFGRWTGAELSAANKRQMWIPEGFAHGFLALEDDTQFLYKTTDVYARERERALRWDDPDVGVRWPLPPDETPRLAAKDAAAPGLTGVEVFA